MKNCLKVGLLFVALFFTGVGTSATSADKDKTTPATVWVDGWMKQTETIMGSIDIQNGICHYEEVRDLHNLFIQKTNEVLRKNLSHNDRLRIQSAGGMALSVLDKVRWCLDHLKLTRQLDFCSSQNEMLNEMLKQ